MIAVIARNELGKVSHPVPPVVDQNERRQLDALWKIMSKGRDYITADDLAGGKIQDLQTRLSNIVDADTVRAVVDMPEHISKNRFLEIMCQDGYRGHKDATTIQLPSGETLVRQERDAVDFVGWVHSDKDVQESEEKQRRLIDSIQAEVLRWRKIAAAKPEPLWHNGAAATASSGLGATFF